MTKNIVFLDLFRCTGLIREFTADEARDMYSYVAAVLEMRDGRSSEWDRGFNDNGYTIIIDLEDLDD